MARPIQDSEWVTSALLLPRHAANIVDAKHRIFSNAQLLFTDTSPGGSFELNPVPQFTRSADLKVAGRFARPRDTGISSRSLVSAGIGRKYAETIAANNQLIHIRMGVAQNNSLTGFFTDFFDGKASYLSKTGRAPGFFYNLGRAAGFVVTLPLQPFVLIGNVYRFAANIPSGKFYYMKPAMPLYWHSATTILNGILVAMGMIPRAFADDGSAETSEKLNDQVKTYNDGGFDPDPGSRHTQGDLALYQKYFPDIFRKGGGIDLYAYGNRSQRLADESRRRANKAVEDAGSLADLRTKLAAYSKDPIKDNGGGLSADGSLSAYLAAWSATDVAKPDYVSENVVEKAPFWLPTAVSGMAEGVSNWVGDFLDFAVAEARDGGQFVTLRVDATGAVSESFNNTSQEPGIKSAINGTSSDLKNKWFDLGNGNIGDGVVSGAIETSVGAVKDLAFGFADSIGFGGLRALAGAAYVDIPDVWQDSIAQMPTKQYKIEIRCWSGDPLTRALSMWVPVACVLAMYLPKSVGKASYDSPFLCELYDKGRTQSRLLLPESLVIERGTGTLGWTRDGHPLGLTMTMSFKDLSTVMPMPINASPGLFDHDNNFNDYTAVLGSLGVLDQIEVISRARLNLTRKMQEFKQWTSPAKYASMFNGTLPGQLISGLSRASDRL
jgi:hypothetical protein